MPKSVEARSGQIELVYDYDSPDGVYVEWQDKEREWRVMAGVGGAALVPDDGRIYEAVESNGVFKLVPLEGLPPDGEINDLCAKYPNLQVYNLALVIPQSALVYDSKGNLGAPFYLEFGCSPYGAAVVVSFKGLNPVTYASAVGELAYEKIPAWGKEIAVQNWIPVESGKKGYQLFRLGGLPSNPALMHEKDAVARQLIFTANKTLGVGRHFLHGPEEKSTLACLFFGRKLVVFSSHLKGSPPIVAETGLSRSSSIGEFEVAAGGRYRMTIPKDGFTPEYYHSEPRVLFRFHPVTEQGLMRLRETIYRRTDAIRSMGIGTFG